MSQLSRMTFVLSIAVLGLAFAPALAYASPAGAIGCAVSGAGDEIDGDALCQKLASELGRAVVRIADARTRRGGALQVVRGDVEWFVAWLRDGEITAWTRVSQRSARGHEIETIVNASRSLAVRARDLDGRCVEVRRLLDKDVRSSDLVYPWQELYPCKGYTTDLVDPWLALR